MLGRRRITWGVLVLAELPFLSLDQEVETKLGSLVQQPDGALAIFLRGVDKKLGVDAASRMNRLVERFVSLPSMSVDHPSMRAYLMHPVRVASFVMHCLKEPSEDVVIVALLHNIFELSGLREDQLETWDIPSDLPAKIRLLTIDRMRESDRNYLDLFYSSIEKDGKELSLVRCMDKLDNLLGSQIVEPASYRSEYIDLAEHYLAPMASRIDSRLGAYFMSLCNHARRLPYLPDMRRRVDEFAHLAG